MNNNGCSRVQRRQNNESNLIVEMKATAAQQQFLFFLSLLVAFVFAILIFGASFAADFVGVAGPWRGVAWRGSNCSAMRRATARQHERPRENRRNGKNEVSQSKAKVSFRFPVVFPSFIRTKHPAAAAAVVRYVHLLAACRRRHRRRRSIRFKSAIV